MFPSYFDDMPRAATPAVWLSSLLDEVHLELTKEIETALLKQAADDSGFLASGISAKLLEKLADLRRMLYKDAQAGFGGEIKNLEFKQPGVWFYEI